MYQYSLHERLRKLCQKQQIGYEGSDLLFYTRLSANAAAIHELYTGLYSNHLMADALFEKLLLTLIDNHKQRSQTLRQRDETKAAAGHWFLSNELAGMSLYVDRFAGSLQGMQEKLDYCKELGINLLHLMPVFESPEGESDGGYAVSDFRKVASRFGSLTDLQQLQQQMQEADMYLMLDIVLNHTSQQHIWAQKARKGDPVYQEYFYMYPDRSIPDSFDAAMPEIFPETAPGNFTWNDQAKKWVMTVFHQYQWDLNYTNPAVLIDMLDNILFYANLGVDILRIDAPAFIWKVAGTTCQNLPQAHQILQLIKQCVAVAAPGMALLGEAIVAPSEIMKYFGTGNRIGQECDFAYHATQMALQWDALATGDTRVMLAAQPQLLQKPPGCSWITYTRCHDDIGLGYDDSMIAAAGFDPYEHRKFLKQYYSGEAEGSVASGALFSVNPKTQDARISGSLASLCGLEKAVTSDEINLAIRKILLMQAQSFFIGGLPMLFYGDELGYTNDYSYLTDPGKSYDNRWMHRPLINWSKNERRHEALRTEALVFQATQKLIRLRKQFPQFADKGNISWLRPHNIHVAGFIRHGDRPLYCLFNYSNKTSYLTWYAFKEQGTIPVKLYDHWEGKKYMVGADYEYLLIPPYGFCLLEVMDNTLLTPQ